MRRLPVAPLVLVCVVSVGCSSSSHEERGSVRLKNDFDNPAMAYRPPWTICESSYRGTEFGKLEAGQLSEAREVPAGLDYVLMVAAWDDPSCARENCLPIASTSEEEVLDGQTRTISINMANHQGPCPPEGVPPIPQAQYERVLELWPEFAFAPYAERTRNPQCSSDEHAPGAAGAAGAGGAPGAGGGAAGSP